jgi:hypothetical protein
LVVAAGTDEGGSIGDGGGDEGREGEGDGDGEGEGDGDVGGNGGGVGASDFDGGDGDGGGVGASDFDGGDDDGGDDDGDGDRDGDGDVDRDEVGDGDRDDGALAWSVRSGSGLVSEPSVLPARNRCSFSACRWARPHARCRACCRRNVSASGE